MEKQNIRLTNDDLIKKISDLKKELNNYVNHDNEMKKLLQENKKLAKSVKIIQTSGLIIPIIIALFTHPYCFFSIFIFWWEALKKEVQIMDNNEIIATLKKQDEDINTKLNRDIKSYEEILEYRKNNKINNSKLRNLNINLKNIPDISYDLQQMNQKYLNAVIKNSSLDEMMQITNLVIDYLGKQDNLTVNNKPNQVQKK